MTVTRAIVIAAGRGKRLGTHTEELPKCLVQVGARPILGWQLAAADVAITDISAMVYDRLATGRPLLVCRPVSPEADVDEGGYLGAAEWLTADEAGDGPGAGLRPCGRPRRSSARRRGR